MPTLDQLPVAEREAVRAEVNRRYKAAGGDDIDRAIARDRKVLAQHDRELDHVATLPFDQHYRWRIAPSVALRAQKDLERQQDRRVELLTGLINLVMEEHGHRSTPMARSAPAIEAINTFNEQFAEALQEIKQWKHEESEAPPPATEAA